MSYLCYDTLQKNYRKKFLRLQRLTQNVNSERPSSITDRDEQYSLKLRQHITCEIFTKRLHVAQN